MHHRHAHGPGGRGFQQLMDLIGLQDAPPAGAGRARRGDVRTATLLLLTEQPMHGYQIIREITDRSGGAWSPSAGSVYPTLQMLADEGLIDSEHSEGKKVYRLTESGAASAAGLGGQRAPWEEAAGTTSDRTALQQSAARLAQAVFQVARTASESQRASATEVLDEARRKLYSLMAQD